MSTAPPRSAEDLIRVERILQEFLHGIHSFADLQQLLRPYVIIDFRAEHRYIGHNSLEGLLRIPLDAAPLRSMLRRYRDGALSAQELSDWAAFVFMSEVFVPTGVTEAECWKAGDDPVWDVLQQLMTPSIFGGLDPMIADEYSALLDREGLE